MLKPNNRLTKVRDFNLVMMYGRWISGQFLRIKWLKLAEIEDYFPKKEDTDKFKKQLKIAISEYLQDPIFESLYFAPNAWAASSMMINLYLLAIA